MKDGGQVAVALRSLIFQNIFGPPRIENPELDSWTWILCLVDRASRYIHVMETNLMHYLSSVYIVSQPLHVSGIFVANHQEVYCIYTTVVTCRTFQLTVCGQQTVNWIAQYVQIVWTEDIAVNFANFVNICSLTVYHGDSICSCRPQRWSLMRSCRSQ